MLTTKGYTYFISKITVIIILVLLVIHLLSRRLFLFLLFRVILLVMLLVTGELAIAVLVSRECAILLRLQQALVQLVLGLEIVDLLLLELHTDLVHLFLCST